MSAFNCTSSTVSAANPKKENDCKERCRYVWSWDWSGSSMARDQGLFHCFACRLYHGVDVSRKLKPSVFADGYKERAKYGLFWRCLIFWGCATGDWDEKLRLGMIIIWDYNMGLLIFTCCLFHPKKEMTYYHSRVGRCLDSTQYTLFCCLSTILPLGRHDNVREATVSFFLFGFFSHFVRLEFLVCNYDQLVRVSFPRQTQQLLVKAQMFCIGTGPA